MHIVIIIIICRRVFSHGHLLLILSIIVGVDSNEFTKEVLQPAPPVSAATDAGACHITVPQQGFASGYILVQSNLYRDA